MDAQEGFFHEFSKIKEEKIKFNVEI